MSAIRALTVKGSIEQLDGIEIFSNVETLSLSAAELEDVDALAALKQLRSMLHRILKAVTQITVVHVTPVGNPLDLGKLLLCHTVGILRCSLFNPIRPPVR